MQGLLVKIYRMIGLKFVNTIYNSVFCSLAGGRS